MSQTMFHKISEFLAAKVSDVVDPVLFRDLRDSPLYPPILEKLASDIVAYEQRDPASRGHLNMILHSYITFRAVLLHRVAHAFLTRHATRAESGTCRDAAQKLAAAACLETGIDIHPGASIGPGFVIDHGWGTVIGETAIVGRDCYVLECVTLGARGISNNPDGKRHPTIGDRVEIGGHARILGDITIGDDCFIAPYAVITEDLPSNLKVVITNQVQFCHSNLFVVGAIAEDNVLTLQTTGIVDPRASIVDDDMAVQARTTVTIADNIGNIIRCRMAWADVERISSGQEHLHLLIEDHGRKVVMRNLHRFFQAVVPRHKIMPPPPARHRQRFPLVHGC